MDRKTTTVAGRTWVFIKAAPDEQFEIECILLRMFGPAAAVGVGVLVEALAREVAGFLAEVVGTDESFDLKNLIGDLETDDARLAKAWKTFLEVLPDVGGELLTEALPVFLGRLDHKDLIRLTQLAVFGKALVKLDGGASRRVNDFKAMALALGPSPMAKYALLAEALRFNYADELAAARAAAKGADAEDASDKDVPATDPSMEAAPA